MEIRFKNYHYDDDIDVLVRAYANQLPDVPADMLFAGEVLFKPHMQRKHERFIAPFPRGIALATYKILKTLPDKLVVQVSNELTPQVRHLTSCDVNYDKRLRAKLQGAKS